MMVMVMVIIRTMRGMMIDDKSVSVTQATWVATG